MLNNRKNKKQMQKHQNEIKKVLQNAVKSHNIAIMEEPQKVVVKKVEPV